MTLIQELMNQSSLNVFLEGGGMKRFAPAEIREAIQSLVANHHREVVEEVLAAIGQHRVVVVGMRQNPVCKAVQKRLTEAKLQHHYLEYGSYFSDWRKRNALKLWTGWPTFPMVFVDGVLVGGDSNVKELIASGQLKASA